MSKSSSNTVSKVWVLAEPIAQGLGFDLWDIEFVKEGSEHFLRVYIDKADGVNIDDCEQMSRALDTPLDELDPIDCSYCLEVCSPGIERKLSRPEHFERFKFTEVKIKLIRPDENGEKEFIGKLLEYDKLTITLDFEGNSKKFEFKSIASIRLNDFEM